MTRNELARLLDHSVLKPEATARDVEAGIAVVREWRIGCYCVQPCRVSLAAQGLAGTNALVAAVIGFPHGSEHTAVKVEAARLAVGDGATELDKVLNLGALKDGDFARVASDIGAVVRATPGIPLKVILEAAALTDAEKRSACRIVRDAGAAFVKTSTGFHAAGGATLADVALMRAEVGPGFGVKASGGIRSLADAQAMLAAGANRLGTSASAAILAALAE
jgi:deoxyribose-phosphate aldolase